MLARPRARSSTSTGAARRCGSSRSRSARSRSARWASRSAALAREVRAASLLAFLLSLPIAFLALVPRAPSAPALYDVIQVDLGAVPVQAGAAGARRARSTTPTAALRRRRSLHLAALALRLRRAPRAPRPARRFGSTAGTTLLRTRWPFPPPACAGCAGPASLRDLVRETELAAARTWSPACSSSRRRRRPHADRRDAGRRPPLDRRGRRGGRRGRGARHPGVLLFGLPADKDEEGSGAWDDEGVVQLATRAIKAAHPDLLVITDVCLCEYTSHGHCGVLRADGVRRQRRDARAARAHRGLPGRAPAPTSSRRAT